MYRKTIEHPEYLPEATRKVTDFESGKDKGRIIEWFRAKGPGQKPRNVALVEIFRETAWRRISKIPTSGGG